MAKQRAFGAIVMHSGQAMQCVGRAVVRADPSRWRVG
jgi:hypothetical protein